MQVFEEMIFLFFKEILLKKTLERGMKVFKSWKVFCLHKTACTIHRPWPLYGI